MRHVIKICTLSMVLCFAFTGCQSHQSKVDALQKEYDHLTQQFGQDCSAEFLKVPPTLSQKCEDEDKHMKQVWEQLLAERSKK